MTDFRQYFAIEKKLKTQGNNLTRAELIEEFTDGKKTGLKELSPHEYKELIIQLNRVLGMNKTNHDWLNSPENKMRRKVYSLFVHKMGYTKETMNNWCVKFGKFHKRLNDHTREELTQLVTQSEIVYASFIKEVNR